MLAIRHRIVALLDALDALASVTSCAMLTGHRPTTDITGRAVCASCQVLL